MTFTKIEQLNCCVFNTGGRSELDGGLLSVALQKLEKEFKHLVLEHSLAVPLPEHVTAQTDDATYISSELEVFTFPVEVMQKLQAIVARLGASNQHQGCVDKYQEIRSKLCEESLAVRSNIRFYRTVFYLSGLYLI